MLKRVGRRQQRAVPTCMIRSCAALLSVGSFSMMAEAPPGGLKDLTVPTVEKPPLIETQDRRHICSCRGHLDILDEPPRQLSSNKSGYVLPPADVSEKQRPQRPRLQGRPSPTVCAGGRRGAAFVERPRDGARSEHPGQDQHDALAGRGVEECIQGQQRTAPTVSGEILQTAPYCLPHRGGR